MKKRVGILLTIVFCLGIGFAFGYIYANKEATNEQANEMYKFQDIESMEKANSVKEAFEHIFGEDRLFDDLKDSDTAYYGPDSHFEDPFDGEIKYYISGTTEKDESRNYLPNKRYVFEHIVINITLKPGHDTRMEMIDFLHYLQYSGLSEPHFIEEALPEDSVRVVSRYGDVNDANVSEETFAISMDVYQQIKPGMNTPEPHQEWFIHSDAIEAMDFSDKNEIFNNITRYGNFEGYNPSGTEQ